MDLDSIKTLIDKTECVCAEQRLCGWHYEYRVETLAAAIQLADEVETLRKETEKLRGGYQQGGRSENDYYLEVEKLRAALEDKL